MKSFFTNLFLSLKKIFLCGRNEENERSPHEDLRHLSKQEMAERIADLIKKGCDDG